MRKCINCVWEGEDNLVHRAHKTCPVCGDNTKQLGIVSSKPNKKQDSSLDLNGDGKVDKKDAKIASKVMNAIRRKKKKTTKKKVTKK